MGGRSLEVRLLGQVTITVDGQAFRLATPRKSLQLLSYILMHRAAPISRDYLAAAWTAASKLSNSGSTATGSGGSDVSIPGTNGTFIF